MESIIILLVCLLFSIAFFTIAVMLIRWALRVNDIVDRLDKIVELLKK